MKTRQESGFTLIELMIVIAIIGILAAVAIPSYNDYIARAQMSEPVSLMSALKAPLAEWYSDKGSFPTGLGTASTEVAGTSTGKYTLGLVLSAATAATISVTATMKGTGSASPQVVGSTVIMQTADGGLQWTCTAGTVLQKFLPSACR